MTSEPKVWIRGEVQLHATATGSAPFAVLELVLPDFVAIRLPKSNALSPDEALVLGRLLTALGSAHGR